MKLANGVKWSFITPVF